MQPLDPAVTQQTHTSGSELCVTERVGVCTSQRECVRVRVQPEEVSFKSDAGGEQQRTHLNEDAHRKYVLNPLSFKTQTHTQTDTQIPHRHSSTVQLGLGVLG